MNIQFVLNGLLWSYNKLTEEIYRILHSTLCSWLDNYTNTFISFSNILLPFLYLTVPNASFL